MKLRYKKVVLTTIMSTMFVGLLTLSIDHDRPMINTKNTQLVTDKKDLLTVDETKVYEDKNNSKDTLLLSNNDSEDKKMDTQSITPTPLPTPLPVYQIEDEVQPEINALFEDSFAAIMNVDITKLKSLLSDPSQAPTKKKLQLETKYIDDYRNIKCYAKKGFENGTYIVYVYYEIKFINIKTPAPALTQYYVVTNPSGELKIFSGQMDEKTKQYYDTRKYDSDVQDLIIMTNKKGEKAKAKDEDLRVYWDSINNLASAK